MTKRTNILLWTAQGMLALLFAFSGSAKVLLPLAELTKQAPIPGWFVRFLGAAELAGALGLILPGALRIKQGLTPLAAARLTVIMAGATVANLIYAGIGFAAMTVVLGCLTAFVAYGRIAGKPDTFRVERTRTIEAPPERIFELIADLHEWSSWSPFEKLDPAMNRSFSGARAGNGAIYAWEGNRRAGAGRMEILEAAPSRILIKVDFLKPFEGHNTAEFTLDAAGGSTAVTWAMYGPQKLMCKVMSLVFDMDRMIGKEFAEGLANLKKVAENQLVLSR